MHDKWFLIVCGLLMLFAMGVFYGGIRAKRFHCKAATGNPVVMYRADGLIVCAGSK